ncbi:MAG TPA: hypothetical protein VHM70_05215 [Polyangiaceae bacterium]|nr:hypothetical protein [Polyangiaceae bacterium]
MPLIENFPSKAEIVRMSKDFRDRVNATPGLLRRADLIGTVDEFWGDYCQIIGERWRARQEALLLIEDSLYQLLTTSPRLARSLIGRAAFLNLLRLLELVRQEHTAVIGAALAEPNVQAMDAENTETGAAWRALKGGNGSIQILESDQILAASVQRPTQRFDDFRLKVLAAFARLLSRAPGRALVEAFLAQGKRVKILPRTQSSQISAQALVNGIAEMNRRLGLYVPAAAAAVHVGPAVTTPFDEAMTLRELAAARGKAMANVDTKTGDSLPPLADSGSDSLIAIAPDVGDLSFLAVDADENPLPTPLFLTIAHELIHALHHAHGVTKGRFYVEHYDNREELETIAGPGHCENAIRAAHHLGVRFSHRGFFSHEINANVAYD